MSRWHLTCTRSTEHATALISELVEPDKHGRAIGALQLCGDAGGTLGPIVGTSLIARGLGVPYQVAGLVILCVLPVSLWLASVERRAALARDSGDDVPQDAT